MATVPNNAQQNPIVPVKAATNVLGTLVKGGEFGCFIALTVLIAVLIMCAVGTYFVVSGWTPTDPTQTTVQPQTNEIEHSSLDRCPAGMTKHYTQRGMVCRNARKGE